MGSLESVAEPAAPFKRENYQGFGQRSTQPMRSRFAKLLLFKNFDYLQWICSVAVFLFFVVVFQMFLPGSVMENADFSKQSEEVNVNDLTFLREFGGLGSVEVIAAKFEALRHLGKFNKKGVVEENATVGSRSVVRFGYRKPKLAIVFADLAVDSYQIQMASVAAALRTIGYDIEVFSLEDGPARVIWRDSRFPLSVMETREDMKINVDWLTYDGILVGSLQAVGVLSCLMQEPFISVPLIWTIHDQALAARLRQYATSGRNELIENWKKVFSRASVVVFPNYILPISYSTCDVGNYFIIPGSLPPACIADDIMNSNKDSLRVRMECGAHDFVIAIVGSQFMYKGLWLDHALVLKALLPVLTKFPSDDNPNSHLRIIILAGDVATNYSVALESIVHSLGYPKQMVKHVAIDEDSEIVLRIADIIIYSSFLEEQSFPDTLMKAMCLGKLIVAPDLSVIKKYVDHEVNGYVFPKENIKVLTQIMLEVVSNGKLSLLARNASSIGKQTAKNLMVSETIEGYASLLEHVLQLPSEVAKSHSVREVPAKLKSEWQWHLFEAIGNASSLKKSWKTNRSLDMIEELWDYTRGETTTPPATNEDFLYHIWEEQKRIDVADARKQKEDEELKARTNQPRGTWEEVYRNARRADRFKNELHERDEGELGRTGQLLCIYEPYFGEGIWPFLHQTSLYRGLGLSSKSRRPGTDDVDAPSRLPLLKDPYYQSVLGEFGAFFAIANRIDQVHKNAWIGFQSWRVTARKESLSPAAEASMRGDIQARKHGDTFYFWARLDSDPRNPLKHDFWTFCDAINAGNCGFAFLEALKKMYGVKHNMSSLPSMPVGGTWSVMHSWVLPTRSFEEFVMFSRMFVDALDTQFYDEHHQNGYCYLSLAKDKHCYSRVLELLINVWAYHSGKRIVFVDPKTGLMEEQHKLRSRRGQMWIKWFHYDTLKSMDEDLAEEVDTDRPKERWLWPWTGEVFWQGAYEKERNLRNREREKRKQQSKDKISRIRNRTRQKALGKYVKPRPEEIENSSSTVVSARLLR